MFSVEKQKKGTRINSLAIFALLNDLSHILDANTCSTVCSPVYISDKTHGQVRTYRASKMSEDRD